jgi:hypothetical protein
MPIHDWTRVDAGIFHDFHHEWISTIKRTLNSGLLPSGYYALAEQVAGGLHPDVLTLESPSPRPTPPVGNGAPDGKDEEGGGTALATTPPRVRFTAEFEREEYANKRKRVVIRHRSGDDVVAIVEIVSPGNKSNRHALRSFVEKTAELLDAGIHLLIIDLFPPSARDPQGIHGAVWSRYDEDKDFHLPAEMPLTLVAYAAGAGVRAFIEPVAVGQALPEMPLFLTPHRYVSVPLEPTYGAAFDAVPKRWRDVLTSAPTG